jgi:hypothetical protein
MTFADHPIYVFVYRIGRGDSEVATVEPAPGRLATRETAIELFREVYGADAEIRRIIEHRVVDGMNTQRDVTEIEP